MRLQEKIDNSIALLRKAEKLALKYNPDDGFYLAFSGGKDSQALYHIAQLAGVKFRAHMNLTSVDPPQVIRFVKRNYPDVVIHAPEKSIYQYAVEKQILPSMKIRWCCQELKEQGGAGEVVLIGIRRQESKRRSMRSPVEVSGRKFGGEMAEFEKWQEEQIRKKYKNLNQDQFDEAKETQVRCINGKDKILISPIIDWTSKDVWEFLNDVVKVPHCELYDKGYSRIGCIGCPMSSSKNRIKELKMFPHVKRNWIKAIKDIRQREGLQRTHPDKLHKGGWRTTNSGLWAGFLIAPLAGKQEGLTWKTLSPRTSLTGG